MRLCCSGPSVLSYHLLLQSPAVCHTPWQQAQCWWNSPEDGCQRARIFCRIQVVTRWLENQPASQPYLVGAGRPLATFGVYVTPPARVGFLESGTPCTEPINSSWFMSNPLEGNWTLSSPRGHAASLPPRGHEYGARRETWTFSVRGLDCPPCWAVRLSLEGGSTCS